MLGDFRGPIICLLVTVFRPVEVFSMGGEESAIPHFQGSSNCQNVIIDLAFVLDSSASVTRPNFQLTKEFVKDFLMPADIDGGAVRVSVIIYSSSAQVVFHMDRHQTKTEVLRAIDAIPFRPGNTNTAAALRTMREDVFTEANGDRPEVDNVAIVITDGTSNSRASTVYQARLARRAGIHVYAVGIGLKSTRELDRIASEPPEENRINVEDFTRLKTLANKVFTTQCTCDTQTDIIFMLDMSGSVGPYGFSMMTQFVADAVRDLQITNDFSRVGLITFNDFPKVVFHFNTHLQDKQQTRDAIRHISYIPGTTNLALALRVARTSMMTEENGDRPDAHNVLVIVTDGVSSKNHLENMLEAHRLKVAGTSIVFIAVGTEGREQLRQMTSPPVDGNLIEVVDLNHLPAVAGSVVHSFCYSLDPCAHKPCHDEGVCVPELRSYTCVCYHGHYGTNCQNVCGPPSDVIVLLDSSTSVGLDKFRLVKSYAQTLISHMDVFGCDINAGVVKFSSSAMIELDLASLDSQEQVLSSIDMASYDKGRSNLANAFRIIRTRIFNRRDGDRVDAQNIVYLVTGGGTKAFRDRDLSEVELLVESGINLVAIDVETHTVDDVRRFADLNGHSLQDVNSIKALLALSSHDLDKSNSTPDPCTPDPCLNGGFCEYNEALLTTFCNCPRGIVGRLCENKSHKEADIVFAVDASRFGSRKDFRRIKRFIKRALSRLTFDADYIRVAVVSFAKSARIRLQFQSVTNKSTIISAVKTLRRMRGSPNPARALNLIKSRVLQPINGDREGVANHVVLVTSDMGSQATIGAVNRLKVHGTRIIGVGINMSPEQKQILQAAVSYPIDQTALFVDSPSQWKDTYSNLVELFTTEDHDFCGTHAHRCQNGGVCYNTGRTFGCRCQAGFAGNYCQRACQDRMDLAFVIETGSTVGLEGFRHIKAFLHGLTNSLNLGANSSQVGVVTMGTRSRAQVFLNSFTTKDELHTAISGIPYKYGASDLASGIRKTRTQLFSKAKGNRPDAPDLMVIITSTPPDLEHLDLLQEAFTAQDQAIEVMAVAVGLTDRYEMHGVVTEPVEHNVFMASSWDQLGQVESAVMDAICRSGDGCASRPCHNGGVCQSDGPDVSDFLCTCAVGFVGKQCEHECAHQKDIAIILDLSGDVTRSDVIMSVHFVARLVEDLTANGQQYHFALMTFNRTVTTFFTFDADQTPARIVEVVHSLSDSPLSSASSESTNGTATATFQPVIQVFKPENGGRHNVEDVAIFIQQGQGKIDSIDVSSTVTQLEAEKVKVISIEIDRDLADDGDSIGSDPSRNVFKVKTSQALGTIMEGVVKQTCSFTDV